MEDISEEKNENDYENENEESNSDDNEEEEEEKEMSASSKTDKNEDEDEEKENKKGLSGLKLRFSRENIKKSSNNISNSNQNKKRLRFERLSTINLKRTEKKNYTILFQNSSSLNNENINYPLEDLKPIPIIISSQKELIYLYVTEDERDFLLKKLDTNNYYAIREEEIKNPLKIFLPLYYQKLFKNKGCLGKRLEISLSDKMKDIKPNFTIAIEMDEKFKNNEVVKEQSSKYVMVKKDILKHLDINKAGIISYDPFSKIKFRENNKLGKEPLPKWAVSLKKQYIDDISESETDNLSDYNNNNDDEDDEGKFNIRFYRKYSLSKKNVNSDNIFNNSVNSDEDEDNEEKAELPYKNYIKKLFYPKLNDFTKNIIESCFNNEHTFGKIDFEKFICLIEFFVGLFSGIQVKYDIDELGFLNMDFYASEKIYMNMAEIFHYQVQFRIRDISYKDTEHNKKPNLIELNTKQYHEYDLNKIEYFPPSTSFIGELSNKFRRYGMNDNYHLCNECEKFFSKNKIEKFSCNSSVFRFIDKTRLLIMTLQGIIDMNYLEKKISMGNDEENEDDEKQNKIFKATMILRNEELIDEIKGLFSFITYLNPLTTSKNKRLNNIFRIAFGEALGYYYTWVSHYLSWILFPSILGLILEIILFMFDCSEMYYIYIPFLILIILWGFYYVRDWDYFQKFYNHIWGIDSFQAEITNLYDDNYSKVSYVIFLGIKIPIIDKFYSLAINCLSIILLFFSSLFIMMVNVGIFQLHKKNFFLNIYINRFSSYIGLSSYIRKYALPIIIYIIREIFSIIFYKFSETLANLERPTDKEEYEEIVTKKRLTLEFVNYNFNLYYIAFYKKFYNTCENNDCFLELRKQIILILISNIFSVITQFIYRIIYLQKNKKNFEIRIMQKVKINSNSIEKFKYYTREQFTEEDIQKLIMPIIFSFGYIIQFGICCPISFTFMLILVLFSRITNGISMIYLFYVKTIHISKGLTVYNKTQFLLVFVGIFSNLGILFYTKNNSDKDFSLISKLFITLFIQNGILIIYFIFNIDRLPFWFRYKENIILKYLKKFGVAKYDKKNKIDNKLEKLK